MKATNSQASRLSPLPLPCFGGEGDSGWRPPVARQEQIVLALHEETISGIEHPLNMLGADGRLQWRSPRAGELDKEPWSRPLVEHDAGLDTVGAWWKCKPAQATESWVAFALRFLVPQVLARQDAEVVPDRSKRDASVKRPGPVGLLVSGHRRHSSP
jgi:hypothetical protein